MKLNILVKFVIKHRTYVQTHISHSAPNSLTTTRNISTPPTQSGTSHDWWFQTLHRYVKESSTLLWGPLQRLIELGIPYALCTLSGWSSIPYLSCALTGLQRYRTLIICINTPIASRTMIVIDDDLYSTHISSPSQWVSSRSGLPSDVLCAHSGRHSWSVMTYNIHARRWPR